ncbi:4Fe-4S binding protein [bacterium SCSIO 12741]|nr:4Fe-4S binding protein [bacterium SCSIO 12741]
MALVLCLSGLLAGAILYSYGTYAGKSVGIKNDGVWFNALSNRGWLGWIVGVVLTSFYVLLYWFPEYLGLGSDGTANTGLIALFDPLSQFFSGKPASHWFAYGTLYTVAIISLGIKFLWKYRGNRYQVIRTWSVMLFQLLLAYLIPEILEGLNQGQAYFAKDLKYMWPLNYFFFDTWHLNNMTQGGNLGMFYLVWGVLLVLFVAPVITYFVGKRWYCSWVCGCGGLAETAGDSFRQLSDKSLKAWKIERILIHAVLVYIGLATAIVLYGYFFNTGQLWGFDIYHYVSRPYGFLIGAAFSGVIGVGFYPVLGSRVWCRFGCPLAAYLGIIQRFKSRFRITTNGGQCISCGNCSTYCEQGIDVRWYAQRGQNIVRASCVGCGICSSVCPRGVLKLENGPEEGRINDNPIIIGKEVKINENLLGGE